MADIPIIINQSLIKRFWEKVEKTDNCWLWKAFKNKRGYGKIGVGSGVSANATRVSWVMHHGEIPEGMFICHKCDNPSCINPDHLFLGTRQDNVNDMMLKKRSRHFQKNNYYGVIREERGHEGTNVSGRWRSVICIDGEMKKIGCHLSVLEAARNYDRIAYMKYGLRDRLNFPEEYNLTG